MSMALLKLGYSLWSYLDSLSEGELLDARITWIRFQLLMKKIICVVGRIECYCENGENSLFVLFLYPQTASLSTDSSLWKALAMREKTNQLMPCERCWLWNQLHPISFLLTTAFVSENELSFMPMPSSVSSAELVLRMAIPPTTSLSLINWGPRKVSSSDRAQFCP